MKSGETIPVRRGLDVARAASVSCVVGHGFCTAPATSAELRLVAAHEYVFGPAETVGMLETSDDPYVTDLAVRDGGVEVPEGPGLGVDIDEM